MEGGFCFFLGDKKRLGDGVSSLPPPLRRGVISPSNACGFSKNDLPRGALGKSQGGDFDFARGLGGTVSYWGDGYPAAEKLKTSQLKTSLHRLRPAIEYNGVNPGGPPDSQKTPRVNPFPLPETLAQEGSRALPYALREVSRIILSPYADAFRGLVTCGYPIAWVDRVEVVLYADEASGGHRVGFGGLRTCDSPWACPVCAPTLAERRGEALARTLQDFHGMGFRIVHAVLTVRHTKGEALVDVFGALANAWRHMTKDRAFRPHWEGLGYARAVEVTYGRNGWHPHAHLALVVPPERDVYELQEGLWDAWSGAVLEVGWAPSSRDAYFYDIVETATDIAEVARYVAKMTTNWGIGPEITGGPRKKSTEGLTPLQLLAAAWWGYLEDPESMASWFPERVGALDLDEDELEAVSPGARALAENPSALTFREFCRTSFWRAKSLGVPPEEAAYRWLEFVESTKSRKALTTSRALGLVFKMKLEEVEREAEKRLPVEIIQLARHTYLHLLRHAKLSYFIHLAEAFASLRRACELLGLIEGVEWFVPPSTGPPEELGAAA